MKESKFVTEGVVDDALIQDAEYEFDPEDRQFIDAQIRGIQQHIIDNPPGASSDGAANVGTGAAVFKAKSAGTFNFRRLKAGTNVSITENEDDLTVSTTGGLGAGSNLGSALPIFKDVSGGTLRHNTIRFAGEKSGQIDPPGYAGELWARPVPPGHFNPNDSGAVADWTGSTGTDNAAAFAAAMTAAATPGNRAQRMLANGHYLHNATLKLTSTVVMQGTGRQWVIGDAAPGVPANRSFPGTMHVFPANTTGIRVKSTQSGEIGVASAYSGTAATTLGSLSVTFSSVTGLAAGDYITIAGVSGTKHLVTLVGFVGTLAAGQECDATVPAGEVTIVDPTSSGERSVISDMTLSCNDAGTTIGHGIYTTSQVKLSSLIIDGFGGDGFRATGELNGNDGNADGCVIDNVQSMRNKGAGFHFEGNDAQVGVIMGCSAFLNGGPGFYDLTRGNTYVGCHGEGNTGPDYKTTNPGSTFLGCYTESDNSQLCEGTLVLGGTLAGKPTGAGGFNNGFALNGYGQANCAPLQYINHRGLQTTKSMVGESMSLSDMQFASWTVQEAGDPGVQLDVLSARYLGDDDPYYAFVATDPHYKPFRLPMPNDVGGALRSAPWAENGIGLGRAVDGPPTILQYATAPHTQDPLNQPLTYERGYEIRNSAPVQGARHGVRCLTPGTIDGANWFAGLTGSIAFGTKDLVLSAGTAVHLGQYFDVAGVTGPLRVVGLGTSASMESPVAGPYAMFDGMVLIVRVFEGALAQTDQTITFHTADFANIAAATATEVAAVIQANVLRADCAPSSAGAKFTITSRKKGSQSRLGIIGGNANAVFGFTIVDWAHLSTTTATGVDDHTKVTTDIAASATVAAVPVAPHAPTFEDIGADRAQAPTLTTDATPTLVRRIPIADGDEKDVSWIVLCRSTDNSGAIRGKWKVTACYGRVAGVIAADEALAITNPVAVGGPTGGPSVAIGASYVDLFVTGIAATNLTWSVAEFALGSS